MNASMQKSPVIGPRQKLVTRVPPDPYLCKDAVVRLQHTLEYLEAYSAYTRDFRKVFILIKPSDSNQDTLIAAVRKFDLYYPDLPHLERRCEVAAATPSETLPRGLAVVTGGWVDEDCSTYVFGDRVIKAAAEQEMLVIPAQKFDAGATVNLGGRGSLAPEARRRFRIRGSLDSWKQDVALEATCSSAAMIAICAAFAAPVVSMIGAEPFVILFADGSSSGKSTVELVGASVIGVGEIRLLPRWKGTEAGVEILAQDFAHMYFPMDDLSHLGKTKKILEKLDEVAYWINSGGIQHKHERAAERIAGRPIPQNPIAAIMITSCEKSIAEMEQLCGERLKEGATNRILELPAAAFPNSEGVVDRLLPENPVERAKFAANWVESISATCGRQHGLVFVKWVRLLLKDKAGAVDFIQRRRDDFRKTIGNPQDKQASRTAKHFEILYACGAYAIERSLIEWSRKSLLDVCVAYWTACQSRKQSQMDMLKQELDGLIAKLNDATRVARWGTAETDPAVYAWRREVGDRVTFRVRTCEFRTWFPTATYEAVLSRLEDKGHLVAGQRGKRTFQMRVRGSGDRIQVLELTFSRDQLAAASR